jgi:hypothetical protein
VRAIDRLSLPRASRVDDSPSSVLSIPGGPMPSETNVLSTPRLVEARLVGPISVRTGVVG